MHIQQILEEALHGTIHGMTRGRELRYLGAAMGRLMLLALLPGCLAPS